MNDSLPPSNALEKKVSVVRRIVALSTQMTLAGCGVAFLAGALARLHWGLELFCHFTIQLALATVACGSILALLKQWKGSAWAALLLAGIVWRLSLALFYAAPQGDAIEGPRLRVALANILVHTRDFRTLRRFIQQQNPDVLVLQELSANGLAALEETLASYSHRHVVLRDDAFGVGIFSRLRLDDLQVHYWSPPLPSLSCKLSWEAQQVQLITTHPLPPVSHRHGQSRNRQLSQLALSAADIAAPLVVVGDLNCTPWSPYFRDLLRDGKLFDTRRFQLHSTWPAAYPWPARIPIDHVLVNGRWAICERHQGPNDRSDHLPVAVELVLQPSQQGSHAARL